MKPITQADLVFTPLEHTPFIGNAVVVVKPNFRLSISKNYSPGMWYVGKDGSYEVGIQCFETEGGKGELVWVGKDTVTPGCDLEEINRLAAVASKLTYAGKIEVFDTIDRTKKPQWSTRFYCAAGRDLEQKLSYSEGVWGKERFRFIPAT